MRQRKLKDLRSKSFQGDSEEWETILKHIFGVESSPSSSPATQDLQVVAEISGDDPDQTITIILRKRIQQISQRLGSFELQQNDDEEVQLFDWTAQAVQDAQSQTAQVERLKTNLDSAKSTIITLEAKLGELVKLKSEQDGQMLAQFAALVNEKKLKIRNQQRILSSAKIDRKALKGLERAAVEEEGEHSKPISIRKRKATASVESSEDNAFDTMDVDEGNEGGLRSRDDFHADTESDRASTPEQETADEQSEPEDPEPKQNRSSSSQAKQSRQRSKQSSKKDDEPATKKDHQMRQAVKKNEEASPSPPPPPRRDLPFNRSADFKGKEPEYQQRHEATSFAPAEQGDDEDEETATEDDDEL